MSASESEAGAPPGPRPGSPPVRARGVSYRYPSGRRGVEGVDLDVAAGEVVGLLGPNGSGKTTLLRLLATDLRPGAGRLELLGREPGRRPGPLRRRLGIADDVPVHPDPLPGRRSVVFFGRAAGLGRAEAERRADALLERLGLSGDAGVPAASYSHGMRRKLLLAQTLVHDPEVLLLDEPTLGLDPPSLEVLRELVAERAAAGAAVVMAANDLPFVRRVAHRVTFLHRGRKVADAPPDELLAGLEGRTTLEIRLDGPVPPGLELPAEVSAHPRPGGLTVESRAGARILPGVCRALLDAGAIPREVRVRQPDLGDVFVALTGDELPDPAAHAPDPDPPVDEGPGRTAGRREADP